MQIEHQPRNTRFIAVIDHQQACLEYDLLPRHGINFTFTYVPESLRGQGIAEQLVRTGLAWAGQQGFAIEASCWYVRRFLQRIDSTSTPRRG